MGERVWGRLGDRRAGAWPLASPPGSVWVCLGEAGSGKTELAVNLALALREQGEAPVRLFDMDCSKGAFRSRDAAPQLREAGVALRHGAAPLDSPVVPDGLAAFLGEEDGQTILDVGGNLAGVLSLGQFRKELREAGARGLYLINPYRSFAPMNPGELGYRLEKIREAAGLSKVILAANPALGEETDAAAWEAGLRRLQRELGKPPPGLGLALYPRWMPPPDCGLPAFGLDPWVGRISNGKEGGGQWL